MVILEHRINFELPDDFKSIFHGKNGLEIDIKNNNGSIVLSHDPIEKAQKTSALEDIFNLYNALKSTNIVGYKYKRSLIGRKLKTLIDKHNIQNYFVFDMAIPDHCIISSMVLSFLPDKASAKLLQRFMIKRMAFGLMNFIVIGLPKMFYYNIYQIIKILRSFLQIFIKDHIPIEFNFIIAF